MSRFKLYFLAIFVWCGVVLAPRSETIACLWDAETLAEERLRLRTTLEIIVGKFPRHTRAYYQWRLADRKAKLQSDPHNDLLLDDVAVSHEKLGQYAKAIEVAQDQLSRNPNRYETLANLGTFYIHDGQYEIGLKFIQKAIEVNPDAHFGREKYQEVLVRYVLSKGDGGRPKLPLGRERLEAVEGKPEYRVRNPLPFVEFMSSQLGVKLDKLEVEKAIEGVLGMMRFSKHDSPILLEVLGELHEHVDARNLAFRCYVSAAESVDDEAAAKAYRKMATSVIGFSLYSKRELKKDNVTEEQIYREFQDERKEAEEWFASLAADEAAWIEEGGEVDKKFDAKYREVEPLQAGQNPWSPAVVPVVGSISIKWLMVSGVAILLVFGALAMLLRSGGERASL